MEKRQDTFGTLYESYRHSKELPYDSEICRIFVLKITNYYFYKNFLFGKEKSRL